LQQPFCNSRFWRNSRFQQPFSTAVFNSRFQQPFSTAVLATAVFNSRFSNSRFQQIFFFFFF
jgi:hypothetical protein